MGNKQSKQNDIQSIDIDKIGIATISYMDTKISVDQNILDTCLEFNYGSQGKPDISIGTEVIELGPGFIPNFYTAESNKIMKYIILEKLYHLHKFGSIKDNCKIFHEAITKLLKEYNNNYKDNNINPHAPKSTIIANDSPFSLETITSGYQKQIDHAINLDNFRTANMTDTNNSTKATLHRIDEFMAGPQYVMVVQQNIIKKCADISTTTLVDYNLQKFIIDYKDKDKDKNYKICQPVFRLAMGYKKSPQFNLFIVTHTVIKEKCRYALTKIVINDAHNHTDSQQIYDTTPIIIADNTGDTSDIKKQLTQILNTPEYKEKKICL
jgi:hypothetical protein